MIKIFVSHASEDKADFVRPLVEELETTFDVWFDEYDLQIGDSLLDSIQRGLRESDYGLVVLSHNFFGKRWTKAELDGLFAIEASEGKKILPVWKDVTFNDVAHHSPILAGRLAVHSSQGVVEIAKRVEAAIIADRAHDIQKPKYQVALSDMYSRNEFMNDDCSLMYHSNEFKITALTDDVSTYTEQFQSDGRITDFSVEPGEIENIRNEESIVYLDSKIAPALKRGESLDWKLRCQYHDSFPDKTEYWVFRQSNPTKNVTIEFIFPPVRPPRNWQTIVRKLTYDEPSVYEASLNRMSNGKYSLKWMIPELGRQSSYKLQWDW